MQTPDASANGENPAMFAQVLHFQTQALTNAQSGPGKQGNQDTEPGDDGN
jgi:hypothetical protein